MAIAIGSFQSWLLNLRRKKLAVNIGIGVISIAEVVTSRFCIGLAGGRIFLGVQADELDWFSGLPWLHVALKKGSPNINIVNEETTLQGVTLPYFCLSLSTGNQDKIGLICKKRFVDVREIKMDSSGHVTGVSTTVARTIPVVMVESDENLNCLLAGRGGKTFTHRSTSYKVG